MSTLIEPWVGPAQKLLHAVHHALLMLVLSLVCLSPSSPQISALLLLPQKIHSLITKRKSLLYVFTAIWNFFHNTIRIFVLHLFYTCKVYFCPKIVTFIRAWYPFFLLFLKHQLWKKQSITYAQRMTALTGRSDARPRSPSPNTAERETSCLFHLCLKPYPFYKYSYLLL